MDNTAIICNGNGTTKKQNKNKKILQIVFYKLGWNFTSNLVSLLNKQITLHDYMSQNKSAFYTYINCNKLILKYLGCIYN